MTAGSIPVPTVVPLRVPGPGESKFNIDTNTRVELRSVVPASENVSIYYTINGTRPDPSGKGNHLHKSTYMYSGPFTLPPGKVVLKVGFQLCHVTSVSHDNNQFMFNNDFNSFYSCEAVS